MMTLEPFLDLLHQRVMQVMEGFCVGSNLGWLRTSVTREWECPECGYLHGGLIPPEECPSCGEPGALFEAYELESDEWSDENEGQSEDPEGELKSWEGLRLVDDSDLADRF